MASEHGQPGDVPTKEGDVRLEEGQDEGAQGEVGDFLEDLMKVGDRDRSCLKSQHTLRPMVQERGCNV